MTVEALREREPPELPADSAGIVLKSSEFRRARENGWRDLEQLIDAAEKRGIRALAPDDLQRLPLLYRSALSSLSVARAIALDRNLLLYLENLALRAFFVVYGPRSALLQGCARFLRTDFPAAVRAARPHLLMAVLAMAVGVVVGFALTMRDEAWFSTLVPAALSQGRGPESTREALLAQEIFPPWPGIGVTLGLMTNFLFSHNTVVGILTFSCGLAAGVPTILLLAYQGLILGAFIALHYNRDLTVDFLGWIAIHGVTEIGAILLCGAAGLVLADKILFPDRYSRVDSLARHGRRAAEIALGAVLLFFVAAILEGVFRQLIANTPGRFAVAAVTAVGWFRLFRTAIRKAHVSSVEAATRLLRGHARATREIVTPEGVTLTVELAEHGERATAFMIDLFFWFCASVLVVLTAVILAARGWVNFVLALSIMMFVSFVIRNFYFIHFELAWRGMTPGKRIVGIRVIDRHGGPLLPSAIVARNFAREIEMFIPLGLLMTHGGGAVNSVGAAHSGGVAAVVRGAGLRQSRPHARRRPDCRHDRDRLAAPAAPRRPGGTAGELRLHRPATQGLWGIRAAGAGRSAAAAGCPGRATHPRRGVRQDLPQDRLARAGAGRRPAAVPARLLHGAARLSRARTTVRPPARR